MRVVSYYILAGLLLISCKDIPNDKAHNHTVSISETNGLSIENPIVYQTNNLTIQKLSNHTFVHTSYLDTQDFGNVPCNGMIVLNHDEAIVFDTPVDNESSAELINYVTKELKSNIKAVIPTHFHEDCFGGLEKFIGYGIPCFASNKTLVLLKLKNANFNMPVNAFEGSLTLNIGDKKVYAEYFGEGHTKDNIIGYFPDDHVIFGGCLIKELDASKGNLEDANIKDWSKTVEKIKQKYASAKIVIPGHGESGGTELLDYTINLFQ